MGGIASQWSHVGKASDIVGTLLVEGWGGDRCPDTKLHLTQKNRNDVKILTSNFYAEFPKLRCWVVSHSKVMNDDDVSRQIVVESPYDTAVTSSTGQEGLATSPSSSQLTCPRRQICLMSHFTRSASWPLTSPNPGFWGQCQVPEDYVKCAHVSCQRGGSGAAFLTFLGQCQTSPPPA